MIVFRVSSQAIEALRAICGWTQIHAIVSDASGKLQKEALRRYKLVMYLERRRRRAEEIERRLVIRDAQRVYRDNQRYMRAAGYSPGLPDTGYGGR